MKSETLVKTENNQIFVEQDKSLSPQELRGKLNVLRLALQTEDDDQIRLGMRSVVPTFRAAEQVNAEAVQQFGSAKDVGNALFQVCQA